MTDDPQAMLEQQKQNCIFCKIIKGEIPSKKVYEDNDFFAILDIRPATEGHVLVMPKEHYPILPVIPKELIPKYFVVTRKIAKACKEAVNSSESLIFIANGAAAGQQSPHFIMHVIPRKENDGISVEVPSTAEDKNQLDALVQGLNMAFGSIFPKQQQTAEAMSDPMQQIAIGLQSNPEVRAMIRDNPEQFRKVLESNPQLKAVFEHIDLEKLSAMLKKMDGIPVKKEEAIEEKKVEEKAPEKKKEGGSDLDKISKLF